MTRHGKSSATATKQDKEFINDLFSELSGIFPAWKQAFDGIEGVRSAKRNWLTGLLESGINSMNQIQTGLSKARKSTYPFLPSIGQFVSWCKPDPEEIGLPDLASAWSEILTARRASEFGEEPWKFSHGIVLAARNDPRCDVFSWRLLSHEKGLKSFKVIYDRYLNQAMNGEAFELPVMIEDKKDRPVTRSEHKAFAEKHLAGLKAAVK